jgi:hypothetical protein
MLAGLLMSLTMFMFYQGLSLLALAFLYLVLQRRINLRNMAPVAIPGVIFLAFMAYFSSKYGELPRFSYRRTLPLYNRTLGNQARSVLTVLGGTAMFPLALLGYWRNWRSGTVLLLSSAGAFGWSMVRYTQGEYSLSTAILLTVFFSIGAMVIYTVLETMIRNLSRKVIRSAEGRDLVFIAVWILGVFFYCVLLLGYAAPRYLLPAVPAVIIMLLALLSRSLEQKSGLRLAVLVSAVFLSLMLSLGLSLAYINRADTGREIADWVEENYGEYGSGEIWYNGELGFRYYMEQKGYRILPNVIGEENVNTDKPLPVASPAPGDLIAGSPTFGNWLAYPETLARMRLVASDNDYLTGLFVLYGVENSASWGTSTILPYNLNVEPERIERIYIWRIAEEPLPILEALVDQLPASVAAGLSEDEILRAGE